MCGIRGWGCRDWEGTRRNLRGRVEGGKNRGMVAKVYEGKEDRKRGQKTGPKLRGDEGKAGGWGGGRAWGYKSSDKEKRGVERQGGWGREYGSRKGINMGGWGGGGRCHECSIMEWKVEAAKGQDGLRAGLVGKWVGWKGY